MELFVRILEVIFPVVAVVGVGAWAGRRHQPEMAVANQLNILIPEGMATKNVKAEKIMLTKGD